MKRICLLFFPLLSCILSLSAQKQSGWDKMKELYLNALQNASDVTEEEDNDFFTVSYDFQVDKWRYVVLSKEDKTVSIHPIMYWYWDDGEIWSPDTTLRGTVKMPSHVTYNDTTYIVTTISKGAFAYSVYIDSLIIPETITTIEDFAFLQSFIKSYTFLGYSLKKVGSSAFDTYCVNAYDGVVYDEYDGIVHRHGYMYSKTPPEGVVFLSSDGKKRNGLLHVPVGCKEVYQQAEGWKQYGENIVDDINLEGIHHAQLKTQDSDAPTYDLHGRRVENPKQGEIYIQKGKKIRK